MTWARNGEVNLASPILDFDANAHMQSLSPENSNCNELPHHSPKKKKKGHSLNSGNTFASQQDQQLQ